MHAFQSSPLGRFGGVFMTDIITVDNLIKKFGEITAVNGVSFSIAQGEMFGLIGPDGAGKTTIIKCLCGLLNADDGDIQILGSDIKKFRKKIQNNIGYLSQRFSLYGDLSIDENVEFFAEIHNVQDYIKRRDELLEFTRLTSFRKRTAEKLSGGMRQKLALACSLIHKPEILFLDEPTTGVDPVSRRDFWKILADLQKEDITILMSTPYLDEAERCNRVALIDTGRIISLDSPQNLKSELNKNVIEIVSSDSRKAYKLLKKNFQFDVQLFGDRINILLDVFSKDFEEIKNFLEMNDIHVFNYRTTEPSLENIFMNLVQK